jgi:hypothetical protein
LQRKRPPLSRWSFVTAAVLRGGEVAQQGRCAADRGEYREAAGVIKPPSLIQMSCFVVMSGMAGSTSKSSRRFRSRRSMNFANAIKPKTSRHSTTNMTMLFVGVGKFAGNHVIRSIFRKP